MRLASACIVVLTVLVASLTAAQALELEPGADASPLGAFAFADSVGTRVLALSSIAEPESVRVLLAAGGRQFPVRYVGFQKALSGGSGRDDASDFEYCEGQLFRLEGGRVWPDETCFLATDSLLAVGQPLPMHREYAVLEVFPGDPTVALKKRELRMAWSLASFSVGGFVALYEFLPQGRSYLATIVLWDAQHSISHDYPAERADPYSVWRVDDAGELCSECFEVLFVLRGRSGYWMATSWGAAEGESLELLRSEGTEFQEVLSAYRYLAAR